MDLPEKIPMRAIGFADGRGGWAMQQYMNSEHKVCLTSERKDRKSDFVHSWSIAALPNQVFATYEALRAAMKNK